MPTRRRKPARRELGSTLSARAAAITVLISDVAELESDKRSTIRDNQRARQKNLFQKCLARLGSGSDTKCHAEVARAMAPEDSEEAKLCLRAGQEIGRLNDYLSTYDSTGEAHTDKAAQVRLRQVNATWKKLCR